MQDYVQLYYTARFGRDLWHNFWRVEKHEKAILVFFLQLHCPQAMQLSVSSFELAVSAPLLESCELIASSKSRANYKMQPTFNFNARSGNGCAINGNGQLKGYTADHLASCYLTSLMNWYWTCTALCFFLKYSCNVSEGQ